MSRESDCSLDRVYSNGEKNRIVLQNIFFRQKCFKRFGPSIVNGPISDAFALGRDET